MSPMLHDDPTVKVTTPAGDEFFVDPNAAIDFAATQRIMRNAPAIVHVLTTDGDWMETDW